MTRIGKSILSKRVIIIKHPKTLDEIKVGSYYKVLSGKYTGSIGRLFAKTRSPMGDGLIIDTADGRRLYLNHKNVAEVYVRKRR